MLPSRYAPAQSSAMRKSRLDAKPSLLPKPRQFGSTDRLSSDTRRPSTTTGQRSSSVDHSRVTYAGGRLSREASNTNLPINSRSRSQQSERYQSMVTPLRSSHFSRPTTTPVRTPTDDRASRSWQASLDRALAFVTVKDQRPITNVAWQRAVLSHVQLALAARGFGAGGGLAIVRPLTIARFVDIAGALLNAITKDAKLNNDNYVTKLPHLSKRLLYPSAVSKSWLKTVNTLHAFPHALALIAYLLDLVQDIEMPVVNEWLYIGKDEQSSIRRDYLFKCWTRFQDPGHQFEDLNNEYLQNLKKILGNNDEKIMALEQLIKKYETCLEDEAEAAARADEARLAERRGALLAALRQEKAARRVTRTTIDTQRTRQHDDAQEIRQLDFDVDRAKVESQQLTLELESQPLSVSERTRLLDEVDYAHRVCDSKRALAEQISKMLLSKETELALWQKKTLNSCVEYKQGLIHLSAEFPQLSTLAIDEKELMGAECGTQVSLAVEALRAEFGALAERKKDHARQKTALARKRTLLLEETRASVLKVQLSISEVQEALEQEVLKESEEAGGWRAAAGRLRTRIAHLQAQQQHYARLQEELEHWERQELLWRNKLSTLKEYIELQKGEAQRVYEQACDKRKQLVLKHVQMWNEKIDRFGLNRAGKCRYSDTVPDNVLRSIGTKECYDSGSQPSTSADVDEDEDLDILFP